MFQQVRRFIRKVRQPRALQMHHLRKTDGAWLSAHVPEGRFLPPPFPAEKAIFERLHVTDSRGKQALWKGYKTLVGYRRADQERTAEEVSTFGPQGRFFRWLVSECQPELIVEIGTAFGLSGMYFLAALEENARGTLVTFEPNTLWAKQAEENLRTMSDRFVLVQDTFEEGSNSTLSHDRKIDFALIDAIHTRKIVTQQFETIMKNAASGALILIDDIDFSDDMKACFHALAEDPRVVAAVDAGRVGVLEIQ